MKGGIVLALALLAGGAAAATPLACADPCVITGSLQGFLPPVAEIATGGSVVWTSPDVSHVNSEDDLLTTDPCFFVEYYPGSPSPPVRFDATTFGLVADGKPCASAVELVDGSFVLPYYCPLHPFTMQGALLVTTA